MSSTGPPTCCGQRPGALQRGAARPPRRAARGRPGRRRGDERAVTRPSSPGRAGPRAVAVPRRVGAPRAAAPTSPLSWPEGGRLRPAARTGSASRACRRQARPQRPPQRLPGLRQPAADHDELHVEHRGRARDPGAERPAGPVQRGRAPRVAPPRPARASSRPSRAGQPRSRAQATTAGPRATASRQPRPPQPHGGPSGSTTRCPTWPALPLRAAEHPAAGYQPAADPVDTTMPSRSSTPRPAPRQCSPTATATASLCSRTGSGAYRSRSAASRREAGPPARGVGWTHDSRRPGASARRSRRRPRPRLVATQPVEQRRQPGHGSAPVGTRSARRTVPSASTRAAASFVPPMSTARAAGSRRGRHGNASTEAVNPCRWLRPADRPDLAAGEEAGHRVQRRAPRRPPARRGPRRRTTDRTGARRARCS